MYGGQAQKQGAIKAKNILASEAPPPPAVGITNSVKSIGTTTEIMNTTQVDQMLATTTNMIMQVDGADDDLENLDEDHSETENSKSNIPTKNGTVSQNLTIL